MAIDNQIYDRVAGTWWSGDGMLAVLRTGMSPVRLAYFREVLDRLGIDARQARALDIGCGGGYMAEEFARLGFRITGVDPSARSLEAARAHAREAGLEIEYRQASGEQLPFAAGSFELAYCCDVLEHVQDLERVIAETARVLVPGGVYLYDTIDRSLKSWLVVIKLFQDWSWSSFLPPRLHEWKRFIRPSELVSLLAGHGLENRELAGMTSAASAWTVLKALRARRRGEIGYAELGRRLALSRTGSPGMLYMGHAVRR